MLLDLKTAWVVQGLVHGHEEMSRTQDDSVIMKRSDSNVIANAKLMEYTEITAENIDSFHFHGTADDYPLTAVTGVTHDQRSGTILRGRFLDGRKPLPAGRAR